MARSFSIACPSRLRTACTLAILAFNSLTAMVSMRSATMRFNSLGSVTPAVVDDLAGTAESAFGLSALGAGRGSGILAFGVDDRGVFASSPVGGSAAHSVWQITMQNTMIQSMDSFECTEDMNVSFKTLIVATNSGYSSSNKID